MQSLTIVQLAPLFSPLTGDACYGSIERIVRLLDAGLATRGHRSVVIALAGSQVIGELLAVSQRHDYGEQARLAVELALAQPVDVIHTHRREFFELGAAQRIRAMGPGVKVVSTLHGPSDKVGRYYPPYAEDSHFVFVSRAQAAGLRQLRGSVIWNATDVSAIPFGAVPAQPRYLLFLGRVCAEKGVAAAIELARRAGLPLKIAGTVLPGDQSFFACAVAPHLRDGQVEYLGPVNDAAKFELLGRSTAVVMLSEYDDPCPLVAIEALAAGAPVVALARGGLPELVEDGVTGLIAEDLAGLSRKFEGLMALDRRRCRHAAVSRFDAGRLVSAYLDVYLGIRQPSSASDR